MSKSLNAKKGSKKEPKKTLKEKPENQAHQEERQKIRREAVFSGY